MIPKYLNISLLRTNATDPWERLLCLIAAMRFPSDQLLFGDRHSRVKNVRRHPERRVPWVDRCTITCRGSRGDVRASRRRDRRLLHHHFHDAGEMARLVCPIARARQTAVDRPRRSHGRTRRRKRRAVIIIIDCYHCPGIFGDNGGGPGTR